LDRRRVALRSRPQHDLPLHEARGRDIQLHLGRRGLLPRAPIAVGIVDIAAARKDLIIPHPAHVGASPLREDARIEDVALEYALLLRCGADDEDLPQVAGRGVERAAWSGSKGGDLRRAGLEQVAVVAAAIDRDLVNASLVATAGEQPLAL